MSTLFLRFPDEPAAIAAMADYYAADYGWKTDSLVHSLTPIGTLYNDDATFDSEGNVITSATPMSGWHVNFIGELPEAAQPYAITPANPRVVFAS